MLAFDLGCVWQDDSKAARLLAEHGQVTAAVRRLMQPLNQAAKAGQPVNPTWADKETLSLLYTYCTSLDSDWALQQVPTAPQPVIEATAAGALCAWCQPVLLCLALYLALCLVFRQRPLATSA